MYHAIRWTFDSNRGQLSTTTAAGTLLCLEVTDCTLQGNQPVALVPCTPAAATKKTESTATCTTGWALKTPQFPTSNVTAPVFLVPPGSPSTAPYCLQSWKGKGAVNIYCCSASKDCSSVRNVTCIAPPPPVHCRFHPCCTLSNVRVGFVVPLQPSHTLADARHLLLCNAKRVLFCLESSPSLTPPSPSPSPRPPASPFSPSLLITSFASLCVSSHRHLHLWSPSCTGLPIGHSLGAVGHFSRRHHYCERRRNCWQLCQRHDQIQWRYEQVLDSSWRQPHSTTATTIAIAIAIAIAITITARTAVDFCACVATSTAAQLHPSTHSKVEITNTTFSTIRSSKQCCGVAVVRGHD